MILTVRKKPVVVEAIFWDGKVSTMQELESMGMKYGACMQQGSKVHCLTITTLEGEMKAEIGDWIIKGIKGEFYPCKPYIFKKTYEIVTEGGQVHCDLCGTNVKVVGHTTMHYEPVVDRSVILEIIREKVTILKRQREIIADAIISAMYGGKE